MAASARPGLEMLVDEHDAAIVETSEFRNQWDERLAARSDAVCHGLFRAGGGGMQNNGVSCRGFAGFPVLSGAAVLVDFPTHHTVCRT